MIPAAFAATRRIVESSSWSYARQFGITLQQYENPGYFPDVDLNELNEACAREFMAKQYPYI